MVATLGPEAAAFAERLHIPPDPWQRDDLDLMLGLRPDDKWACHEYGEIVPRQNGKSLTGEIRALFGFLVLGDAETVWTAHEYRTCKITFNHMLFVIKRAGLVLTDTLVDLFGVPIKVSNTNGEEGFKRLDTGGSLKFQSRTKGAGRGFTCNTLLVDEGFALTPEQHSALFPTMSAVPNSQIVYLSSPPLDGESGEVLYTLRARAVAGGDPSLGFRCWGQADANLGALDKVDFSTEAALAANPAAPHRISVETIERERRSMGRAQYARERLNIWPLQVNAGGVVLDPDRWAQMRDPESRRVGGGLALAVDVTPLRDAATIGLYGPGGFGTEHMRIVDHRPGTGWVAGRLAELRDVLNPLVVALDAKNGAAALIPELEQRGFRLPEDPEHPEHGDLLVTNAAQMADAVGQFIDGFRLDAFRHHGQEPLDLAVRNARARPIGDAGAIAWGRRASEVDIGPLITVTLARYAYLQRSNVKDKTVVLTGSLMA